MLAKSIGCDEADLVPRAADMAVGQFATVCQYDGVKIVVRRVDICQHEVDGWREHFGPLADIWS